MNESKRQFYRNQAETVINKDTPCAQAGICGNCLNGSICSQIVISRTSMVPHRIKVILVGEELGY